MVPLSSMTQRVAVVGGCLEVRLEPMLPPSWSVPHEPAPAGSSWSPTRPLRAHTGALLSAPSSPVRPSSFKIVPIAHPPPGPASPHSTCRLGFLPPADCGGMGKILPTLAVCFDSSSGGVRERRGLPGRERGGGVL